MSKKIRSEKIDYFKGIAILLVIYGHSIQFCMNNGQDFFKNKIFIFIYTFHMPLFMLISGYLYYYTSNSNTIKQIVLKKFRQLIVPAMAWYTIYTITIMVISLITKRHSFLTYILGYIRGIPYQFWYLIVLFYLSIIFIIIKQKFKDKIIYYVIVFLLLLSVPDKFNFQFLKFMYPYFFMGYMFNKYKYKFILYKKSIINLSIILYLILLLGWKKDYYIYTTGMSLYNNILDKLYIVTYRYITGIVGSISIIAIMDKIFIFDRYRVMSLIGKYTLGIYIIQQYIMIAVSKINISINNIYIYIILYIHH